MIGLYIYSTQLKLPPIEIQPPTSHKQQNQITPNIRRQDPQIPPPRIETDAKLLVELIPNLESTVRAVRGGVGDEVSRSASVKKRGHIFAAGLADWGGEEVEFGVFAEDGKGVEFG